MLITYIYVMEVLIVIGLIIGAYLLGSIPSAVWIGKAFFGIDVREHGSHNAGATNTMRVLGRRAALPVFLIDAGKGYAAVMLSYLSTFEPFSDSFVNLRIALAIAAVLGHIFPLFAGFKGGKGVATITGCIVAMSPLPALLCFITFVIVLLITHYVSVGSMVGGIMFPIYIIIVYGFQSMTMIILSVVIAILLLITHRKNIRRLRDGVESKTYPFRRNKPQS